MDKRGQCTPLLTQSQEELQTIPSRRTNRADWASPLSLPPYQRHDQNSDCGHRLPYSMWLAFVFYLGVTLGVLGTMLGLEHRMSRSMDSGDGLDVAPQIRLDSTQKRFQYGGPFETEPPGGEENGNISEPIWDSLVPSKSPKFVGGLALLNGHQHPVAAHLENSSEHACSACETINEVIRFCGK